MKENKMVPYGRVALEHPASMKIEFPEEKE